MLWSEVLSALETGVWVSYLARFSGGVDLLGALAVCGVLGVLAISLADCLCQCFADWGE